ncbi:MAG: Gfo/Idh/MocA family oxidoreductase [Chloroflexi bacterium]|nr:Gfo/Idh/MocA family oxidoreductase [Chloroflexota bacterium]
MHIGIMSFAHHHAEAYIGNLRAIPGVEMIGIADDDLARGQKFAQQYDAHLFPSYEALLAAKPDGVLVCSENANHRPLVEMAAQAGVHILCEKPLATTREDAQAIIAACRSAGVILMTAFPMRFSAPLQQLKARLDAGDLGQVFCLNSANQGEAPIAHRAWFVDKELAGGGAMMDHIVHLADIFNWFFGRDTASVYAQCNHILQADKVDVETGGLVMLQYANGLFATIDTSWSKPLNYPTWGGLTMELVSERGLTVVDAFSQNLNVYRQEPPSNQWAYWGSDMNQAMIAEFVAAIREGRETVVTGEDGLFALEIALAAYKSAETNQPTKIKD